MDECKAINSTIKNDKWHLDKIVNSDSLFKHTPEIENYLESVKDEERDEE